MAGRQSEVTGQIWVRFEASSSQRPAQLLVGRGAAAQVAERGGHGRGCLAEVEANSLDESALARLWTVRGFGQAWH